MDLGLDGAGSRFSGVVREIGLGMGQGQCCGSEKEVGDWKSERDVIDSCLYRAWRGRRGVEILSSKTGRVVARGSMELRGDFTWR